MFQSHMFLASHPVLLHNELYNFMYFVEVVHNLVFYLSSWLWKHIRVTSLEFGSSY